MRPILVALLLPALALLPLAGADGTVTVHLVVDTFVGAPALASCDVDVPAGADGAAVLDAAVANGCILEWTAGSYPGLGRYVTSIDHVSEELGTYWSFVVDGEYASYGIDLYHAEQGSTIRFAYDQYATYLLPPLL